MFAAGSSSLVSVHREQTRPSTKHATQQHTASRNAGKLRGDRHCCCCSGSNQPASAPSDMQNRSGSSLIHSLQPGGQAGSSVAPSIQPCVRRDLPETGRGLHLDVAARRRGSFPLLPVRHAAPFSFLRSAVQLPGKDTWERSGDRMLPSKTVGNIVTT